MIRFLNKEAVLIEKCNLNLQYLQKFFSKNLNEEAVLIVCDKGNFYGIITYDSWINNKEKSLNEMCIKERIIHESNDESIWSKLNKIFDNNKELTVIPIFNERENFLYLAYQDIMNEYDKWVIDRIIQDLEILLPDKFFREVYSLIEKIQIYDLNEIGYRFYSIMKRCGYYIETIGDSWKLLFPDTLYITCKEGVPEKSVMKVYAEGRPVSGKDNSKKRVTGYWWQFLVEIAGNYYRWLEKQLLEKCRDCFFMRVDVPIKVEFKTTDEEKRWQEEISYEVLGTDSETKKELFWKAFGRKITLTEWESEERTEEELFINGEIVKVKYIGDKEKRKIYIIGPCIVRGITVPCDEESLLYCLYEGLKKRGIDCCIIGIVVGDFVRLHLYKNVLESLTIMQNDILISIFTNAGKYAFAGQRILDLKPVYEQRDTDWFYNVPMHTNYAGNQAISSAIEKRIYSELKNGNGDAGKYLQIGLRNLSSDEKRAMKKYINSVKRMKYLNMVDKQKIGAIVMNCNPMTNGHLYLIDFARKEVDYLYVFIVEEDRSENSFNIRYRMVQKQTECLNNVFVVPSGQFVLSYRTMPLYFEKAQKKNGKLDATKDLQLFCQYIAPQLGISERFVGDEPEDKVTKQYNDEMGRILPYYGMKLIQIPRLKYKNDFISASKVRKFIKQENWEKVKQLVPDKVYKILIENMRR